jgi:hypothetical protein
MAKIKRTKSKIMIYKILKQKAKYQATQTPLKPVGQLRC